MAKEKVKSEYEVAVEEFFSAASEVRQARSNFNNADAEYFEIANAKLSIAQEKYNLAGKRVKLLSMSS